MRDSDSLFRRVSVPKSNSWLPTTPMSNPMASASAIMCAPLSIPDISDGEIMSPPKVTIAWPPAAWTLARSSATTFAIRAAPPAPFLPSIRSQSLTCIRVRERGWAARGSAMNPRTMAVAAATVNFFGQ